MISIGDIAIEFENNFVDKTKLLEKLNKQLKDLENELKRSDNILNNKNFLLKAPKEKIAIEQQKRKTYQTQYDQVKQEIKKITK
ncbi:MAG: hypothetical protein K2L48_03625 [Mycoplasmoidaceae bacterium]|nr:hypothetical protein [Mycoplasmoidaceae bacterium]